MAPLSQPLLLLLLLLLLLIPELPKRRRACFRCTRSRTRLLQRPALHVRLCQLQAASPRTKCARMQYCWLGRPRMHWLRIMR